MTTIADGQPGRHQTRSVGHIRTTGAVVSCAACGGYATRRPLSLLVPCGGPAARDSFGRIVIRRIAAGHHPAAPQVRLGTSIHGSAVWAKGDQRRAERLDADVARHSLPSLEPLFVPTPASFEPHPSAEEHIDLAKCRQPFREGAARRFKAVLLQMQGGSGSTSAQASGFLDAEVIPSFSGSPGTASRPSADTVLGAAREELGVQAEAALEELKELQMCGLQVILPLVDREPATLLLQLERAATPASTMPAADSDWGAAHACEDDAALKDLRELQRAGLRVAWPRAASCALGRNVGLQK